MNARRAALLFFLSVAACVAQTSTPPQLPADTHHATATPPSKPDRCAALVAENAEELRTDWSARVADKFRPQLDPLLTFCASGRDGAWALKLDDVNSGVQDMEGHASQTAADAVFVRLALRYHFDDGHEAIIRPSVFGLKPGGVNLTLESSNDQFGFEMPTAFDFDADGTPEVILHLSLGGMGEGRGDDVYSVWSMANGAITGFAPVANLSIVGVVDRDHDARPDFVVDTPYVGELQFSNAVNGCMSRSVEVRLLLHAAPPALSSNDAVALAFAREQCAKVDVPLARIKDGEDAFRWAACQRLSGHSRREVEEAYGRRCPVPKRPTDCDDSVCGAADLVEKAASAKPPLVLPNPH